MLVKNSQEVKGTSSNGGGRRFFFCNNKAGTGDDGAGKGAGDNGAGEGDDKNKGGADGSGDDGDDGKDNDNKPAVPLYKFRNLKDKFEKLSAEIEGLRSQKSKEEEEKLKEQGKLKELLEAKDKELLTVKESLKSLSSKAKEVQFKSMVKDELSKHNPRDVRDIMALLEYDKLEVEEDDDGNVVEIKGLTKMIEKIKKEKDYLFGESRKNDNKDSDENNRQGAGDINSLEAEYRQLLEKPTLTIAENNRLREVSKKIKELREKK